MRVDCPLCRELGGELVWQDDALRVILVDEPDLAGFTRVVWQAHVAEMTDLPPEDRARLLDAVLAVEAAMRAALRPDKINLASLGNVVPHLHWHVVPRFADDPRFPGSPWTPRVTGAARPDAAQRAAARAHATGAALPAYRAALIERLDALKAAARPAR